MSKNVIVFGETGAGKSSVINQVLRRSDAPTSNTAAGCTFENTPYEVAINNEDYILYDTAGFNEVSTGTVSSPKAIANLYNLVCSLEDSGGVNLLILVFKCGRLTETTRKNYKLFYAAFCETKVPIVIVITACETEEPMDKWWGMNEETFKTAGMVFNSHACVCTVRGRKINGDFYANDDLVALSTLKVETLIRDHCSEDGWKKPPLAWFKGVLHHLFELLNETGMSAAYRSLYQRLLDALGTDSAQVSAIINEIIIQQARKPNKKETPEPGHGRRAKFSRILFRKNQSSKVPESQARKIPES